MKNLKYLAACLLFSLSQSVVAGSKLSLTSDSGDYIGGGQSYEYSDLDSTFSFLDNFSNGISVTINTGTTSWWRLDLAAPGNERLQPGLYENATRFPFNNISEPGLSFYGNGRGCNTLTGSFTIYNVSYNASGVLKTLSASFVQHCEGGPSALRGTITYDRDSRLGADSVGMLPLKAACANKTTGQKVLFDTSNPAVNCKKQRLHVNPGDVISVTLHGVVK